MTELSLHGYDKVWTVWMIVRYAVLTLTQ